MNKSSQLKPKARVGRPSTSQKTVTQVQSLSRGLLLLEKVAQANGVLTVDLAEQVSLPVSTVHRLLSTLESQGFVRREEPSHERWFVGVAGFRIGSSFLNNRDVVKQARPFMQVLVDTVGETSNLSVLQDGKTIILAQQQCTEMMRMMVPVGSSAPLHASGVGKAILAFLPAKEQEQQLANMVFDKITQCTITSRSALQKELLAIRNQGWAFDDQEHALGLRCIAACLYDEESFPIAAISVSGPRARIVDSRIVALGETVKEMAQQITAFIGGVWPQ